MLKPKVIITGIPKALLYIKAEKERRFRQINDAIHREGLKTETEVKESIAGQKSEPRRVDTGNYLNSIQTDNSVDLQSVVFSEVEYGPFVENGTDRMAEGKHFQNSLGRRKPDILDAVDSASK